MPSKFRGSATLHVGFPVFWDQLHLSTYLSDESISIPSVLSIHHLYLSIYLSICIIHEHIYIHMRVIILCKNNIHADVAVREYFCSSCSDPSCTLRNAKLWWPQPRSWQSLAQSPCLASCPPHNSRGFRVERDEWGLRLAVESGKIIVRHP